eukprot:539597-Prymnesium_polylepis.1
MDTNAKNFAPDAAMNRDDVLVLLEEQGFTVELVNAAAVDPDHPHTAAAQRFLIQLSDAACILTILGCMSPLAANYNSVATRDDGSCIILTPPPTPPPPPFPLRVPPMPLSQPSASDGPAGDGQKVAEAFRRVISAIANRLVDSMQTDAEPIAITTDVLNITIEKRSAEQLTAAPFRCDTSTTPVVVQLPQSLANSTNISGKAVGSIMWATSVPLYTGLSEANSSLSGPMISFELRADGIEVPVSGLSDAILLRLPLSPAENSKASCVGQPTATSLLERLHAGGSVCNQAVEC